MCSWQQTKETISHFSLLNTHRAEHCRLKAHLFGDSLVIVWIVHSSQINCPKSQEALIKQIPGTLQTATGSSADQMWGQQSHVPDSRLSARPGIPDLTTPVPTQAGIPPGRCGNSSKVEETQPCPAGKLPRAEEHRNPFFGECRLSSPLVFSGRVSCLFSSSWYASLERRAERFRKAADTEQNKPSSSKEARKVMLAKVRKSKLASNYYLSKRP